MTDYARILKYNHNHDPANGRFSSGDFSAEQRTMLDKALTKMPRGWLQEADDSASNMLPQRISRIGMQHGLFDSPAEAARYNSLLGAHPDAVTTYMHRYVNHALYGSTSEYNRRSERAKVKPGHPLYEPWMAQSDQRERAAALNDSAMQARIDRLDAIYGGQGRRAR